MYVYFSAFSSSTWTRRATACYLFRACASPFCPTWQPMPVAVHWQFFVCSTARREFTRRMRSFLIVHVCFISKYNKVSFLSLTTCYFNNNSQQVMGPEHLKYSERKYRNS